MSKKDPELFAPHKHAVEKEKEVCPQCGSELIIRNSKSGPFIGCANYPTCNFTRNMGDHHVSVVKLLDQPACPECASQLAVKNGRYGMFIGCSHFPECSYVAHLDEQEDTGVACPSCKKGELLGRNNRYGKTFFACNAYPKCKYAVNFKPVLQTCPQCQWQLLIEKQTAKGLQLQCPQKSCDYKAPIQ
ncbi:MAG: putative DNA topoisomerase [Alteromonadaceae bacterium]|jgi:putative DNA topoisomerase